MVNFAKLVALLLCILSSHTLMAQVPKTSMYTAEEHIQRLHEGVLLIRLQTNQNKINALESLLDSSSIDTKDAEKIQKTLNKTIAETNEKNNNIVTAFDSEYAFSEYAFFFDKDSKGVFEGDIKPLGSDLETPVEIDHTEPLYILAVGRTQETSRDGYVILDGELDEVPRPFPSNYIRGGFAGIFASLGKKGEKPHVGRINKKLFKYYYQVTR